MTDFQLKMMSTGGREMFSYGSAMALTPELHTSGVILAEAQVREACAVAPAERGAKFRYVACSAS